MTDTTAPGDVTLEVTTTVTIPAASLVAPPGPIDVAALAAAALDAHHGAGLSTLDTVGLEGNVTTTTSLAGGQTTTRSS